jgi:hypothetical protein
MYISAVVFAMRAATPGSYALTRRFTRRPPGRGSTAIRERSATAAGESGIPSLPTSELPVRPRKRLWKRSHGLMMGPVVSSGLFCSSSFAITRSESRRPRSSSYSVA